MIVEEENEREESEGKKREVKLPTGKHQSGWKATRVFAGGFSPELEHVYDER